MTSTDLLSPLQAMDEIKELAPQFIEGNKDVDFTLHTAKFYQEASHGNMPEAIAYSRAHMTPLTHNCASRTEMLKASSWVWHDRSAACHHWSTHSQRASQSTMSKAARKHLRRRHQRPSPAHTCTLYGLTMIAPAEWAFIGNLLLGQNTA